VMGVTIVAISIGSSRGASLLLSSTSHVSMTLHSLPLALVITSVRLSSLLRQSLLLLARWPTRRVNRVVCQDITLMDTVVWLPPPAIWTVLERSFRGQLDVRNRVPQSVFQLLSMLLT
jgi:hypothetical protein